MLSIISIIISASTALHPGKAPVPDTFAQPPPPSAVIKLREALSLAPMQEMVTKEPPSVAGPQNGSRAGAYSPNLYEPGQCVWGVKAWRPDIPGNWHNARDWLGNAQATGWPTGPTPRVGAVGTKLSGNHVVLVLSVHLPTVTIREMNYDYVPFHVREAEHLATDYYYIY